MTKPFAFLLSACLAACAGEAQVRYTGTVAEPELVAMDTDPSVMVVANADEPVFYTDNSYWLYRDRHWYRSQSHRGGWARIDQPPEHVRRIQRPEVYVHYRHGMNAPRATYNERRDQVPTPRPDMRDMHQRDMMHDGRDMDHHDDDRDTDRDDHDLRDPRDQRRDQVPPVHEPNPQGPAQPYPNPLPPQQVPPGR
ncbi:MAG TPA: hypothetical protein VFT22_41975 [Kofleriaceae bacterium]|nr:hypothetical protein [Kofleriaceae bacterium]